MLNKKTDTPSEFRNKVQSADKVLLAHLRGQGPFLLPIMTKVESILEFDKDGIEIRLETKSGKKVRIQLTAESVYTLQMMMAVYESRKTSAAARKTIH